MKRGKGKRGHKKYIRRTSRGSRKRINTKMIKAIVRGTEELKWIDFPVAA